MAEHLQLVLEGLQLPVCVLFYNQAGAFLVGVQPVFRELDRSEGFLDEGIGLGSEKLSSLGV